MSLAAQLLIARATVVARHSARTRRCTLEQELAGYRSASDRQDFEALLDQYSDGDTAESRYILAGHTMSAAQQPWPAMHGQRVG